MTTPDPSVSSIRYRALQDLGRRRPEQWKLERLANPQVVWEWLPKLEAIASDSEFHANLDAQVILITFLQEFRALIPKRNDSSSRSRIEYMVIDQLKTTGPWLDYVFGLERVRDVRAALKSRRVAPTQRLTTADEEFYPTTGWIGEYLKWVRESESPPAWHFWSAVTCLGAAARRNLYMGFGDYYLYPNHYVVFVGSSATGKSVAFKPPQDVLVEANRLHDLWRLSDATLLQQLSSPDGPALPVFPEDLSITMLASYPSPQYIVQALMAGKIRALVDPRTLTPTSVNVTRRQSIGWLANDELKTIFGDQTFAPEQLIALLTDFYNCHDTGKGIGTIARGSEQLRDICLSFLGASTLEWLTKGVTPAVFEGGFMSRILYVARDTSTIPFYPSGTPQRDPLILGRLARAMLPWMLVQPIELEPHPTAVSLFQEIRGKCREQAEAADARLAPYYKRKFNHILKLAMVFTMSDLLGEHDLDLTAQQIEAVGTGMPMFPDNLERACRLVEYEEQFIEPCFAAMGRVAESDEVDKLVRIVCQRCTALKRPVRITEMRQNLRYQFGIAKRWRPLLDEAVAEGTVRREMSRGRPGQPIEWIWDPRLFQRVGNQLDAKGIPEFKRMADVFAGETEPPPRVVRPEAAVGESVTVDTKGTG